MNKVDRRFVFILLIFVIVIGIIAITATICVNSDSKIAFAGGSSLSDSGQTTEVAYAFPVDLNKVSKEQLMQIDGIGEKTAQKIIDYRTEIGQYKSINELLNVDSIGEKTLEKLKKYLYVENDNNSIPEAKSDSSSKTSKAVSNNSVVTYPLDINFCTYNELVTLPGIGEDKANRIINYRKTKGYFYSIEEIMQVDGIGQKTFDEIKSKIKVDVSRLPKKQQVTSVTTTTQSSVTVTIPLHSVNVNTATYDEFMKIPGIKDYTARAIINHRSKPGCRFVTVEEVEIVLSFEKTNQFLMIRQYLTV